MYGIFKLNAKSVALILLFIYAALPIASPYSQIILYITIPSAAVLSLIGSKDRRQSKYMRLLLMLFIWIVFTSFFSYDIDISFVLLRRVLAVFLLCLAVHQIAKNEYYIFGLYLVWIVIYCTCLIYARDMIDREQLDYVNDRVSDENLNANTLGYYTFFSTVIIYFLGNNQGRFVKFFRLVFLLIIPLSFYIAIITASRQILIIQIPLIVFLLFIRYVKEKRGIQSVLFVLTFIILIFVFASSFLRIYESSYLSYRSQMDVEEDVRSMLIRDGIRTGMDNILTGVGVGCFGDYNYGHSTFAHNTYVELFATTGIVGSIIYVYMILSFIIIQFKRYVKLKNTDYLVFSFVGIVYAVDNMFYVFHTDPWLMAFFILITSHAEMTYKKEKDEECHKIVV